MSGTYKTISYFSDVDDAYIVFAPDLPGCFADGKTVREAQSNMLQIIEEWKADARELNREVPFPLRNLESSGASVFDIAKYILHRTGKISTMMLQMLLYYSDAWSLAWFQTPLFPERFEAWTQDPVCRDLYTACPGHHVISEHDITTTHRLSESERKLVDNVLSVYADWDIRQLSALTRTERPWIKAHNGMNELSPADMTDYYGGLCAQEPDTE